MARNVSAALELARPESRDIFGRNLAQYTQEIDSVVAALKQRGAALKGMAVIGYHPDISYLCAFYEMDIVGHIEPKAGVAPTASHLRDIEALARQRGVRLIIHNQSQSPKVPQRLGRSLQCPVVEIANAVGAKSQIATWLQLQEYNNRVLLNALGGGK